MAQPSLWDLGNIKRYVPTPADGDTLASSLMNYGAQYVPQPIKDKWAAIQATPGRADNDAERLFPDEPRDSSRKNAFRHALGTADLTRELGGTPAAGVAAKMAGYLWEGIGAAQHYGEHGRIRPEYKTDTRHDLNANNIGASLGARGFSRDELVQQLQHLAKFSKNQQPVGFGEYGNRHMTHTAEPTKPTWVTSRD